MLEEEKTWVPLDECYEEFGYRTMKSALKSVRTGHFPVDTYLLAGRRVVDKEVKASYFRQHRERGLDKLENRDE